MTKRAARLVQPATKPPKAPVIRVHKTAADQALQQADGDPLRIEVISETEVRVHNNRNWRTR